MKPKSPSQPWPPDPVGNLFTPQMVEIIGIANFCSSATAQKQLFRSVRRLPERNR